MSNKDLVEAIGLISEIHRGGLFTIMVRVNDVEHQVLARPSGKMKKYGIKLVMGDEVDVELSPYDLSKGRITYRRKQ